MTSPTWKYDVALSYAGEDREVARELATRLQAAGYLVFYDGFEELWGQDLSVKLHQIYGEQSRYGVPLVSQHYVKKPWTNHERQVLLARAMKQQAVYLLPIRLDDSALPGLADVVAYKDLRQTSLDEIISSLQQLLGPPRSGAEKRQVDQQRGDVAVRLFPRNFLGIVVQQNNLEAPWFNLDCTILNEGRAHAHVKRLEAHVTPVGKRPLQFAWNVFYGFRPGGRVMEVSSAADPLELAPASSCMLGVQFRGPRLEWPLQWPAGEYDFELLGWADCNPREHDANLRTRFSAVITTDDLRWLNVWATAPDAEWRRLNDPHNAVAVPIAISPSSLKA